MIRVVVFLLIVLLLALTAGVIWILHRNQLRRQLEVVDRSRDLPPLESAALPDFTVRTADAAAIAAGVESASSAELAVTPAADQSVTPAPVPAENINWQDQVKTLKDSGELDAAGRLCQQHFPKAQAFQQAAVLLRIQLRQQLEQQQPTQPLAGRLYRCAVLANLFRTGGQLKPINARQAMQELASVEFPYKQIGHQQLKLLTKSDIKLLEQLWGTPDQHIHAEQALGVRWEQLCRR